MSHKEFTSANNLKTIQNLIQSIFEGKKISQDQQTLAMLREQPSYCSLLCLMYSRLGPNQSTHKLFILLELKKIIYKIDKQSWKHVGRAYFADGEKQANIIGEIALGDPQFQLLGQLINVNLTNIGIVGYVRYLRLLCQLFSSQLANQSYKFIQLFGANIFQHLFQILQYNQQDRFIHQIALSLLYLIKGFIPNIYNEQQIIHLIKILQTVIFKCKDFGLTFFLVRVIKFSIENPNQNKEILIHQQNFKNAILSAVIECLRQVQQYNIRSKAQKRIYIDVVKQINIQFFKCKQIILVGKNNLTTLLQSYSRIIQSQIVQPIQYITCIDKDQDYIVIQSKFCILQSILSNISQILIKQLILKFSQNYQTIMIQFVIYFKDLHNNRFIRYLNHYLVNLANDLNRKGQYLLNPQRNLYLLTLFKYIVKYHQSYQDTYIFQICQILDQLATKCSSVSNFCYQIIDMLTPILARLPLDAIINFVFTSLTNINNNEYLRNQHSYNHIIGLIVNIQIRYVNNSLVNCLAQEIGKMIENIVQILCYKFDYQVMHKLNQLFEYMFLNKLNQTLDFLTNQILQQIINFNYNHFIYTKQAGQIDFYYNTLELGRPNFFQRVNLYGFWNQCQSQRLQYFIDLYLRLLDSIEFPLRSQIQHKNLPDLKANLWKRYLSQRNVDQRKKIINIFKKHKEYLFQLYSEFHRYQILSPQKQSIRTFSKVSYPKIQIQ